MWNVDMVTREYGSGPLLPCEVDVGVLTVSSHKQVGILSIPYTVLTLPMLRLLSSKA